MHLRNLLPALSLLLGVSAYAQQVKDLGQVSMSRWAVPAANYSGITPLGADRYALVSDKEPADGFYVITSCSYHLPFVSTNGVLVDCASNPNARTIIVAK